MLEIAKKTIEAKLEGRDYFPSKVLQEKYSEPQGCFVTLYLDGLLKGCIGIIEPIMPLWKTIKEASKSAAFQDPRFNAITQEELERVKIEISVLSLPTLVEDVSNIIIGQDGLIIKKDNKSGLLLPQVAIQQGWNRDEFLNNVCLKAGLHKDCWKEKNIHIFKFQAKIYK